MTDVFLPLKLLTAIHWEEQTALSRVEMQTHMSSERNKMTRNLYHLNCSSNKILI